MYKAPHLDRYVIRDHVHRLLNCEKRERKLRNKEEVVRGRWQLSMRFARPEERRSITPSPYYLWSRKLSWPAHFGSMKTIANTSKAPSASTAPNGNECALWVELAPYSAHISGVLVGILRGPHLSQMAGCCAERDRRLWPGTVEARPHVEENSAN